MTRPPLTLVDPTASSSSPPSNLGPAGLSLWNSVMAEYQIADVGGLELLAEACAARDRVQSLREAINRDGETFVSRSGLVRAHPALRDELAGRAFVCRMLEKLGITVEPLRPVGRPPKGSSR